MENLYLEFNIIYLIVSFFRYVEELVGILILKILYIFKGYL